MGDAMRVRFLVSRTSEKILYMEAGKEFVDMLLGFLQLPVATILSVLRSKGADEGMEVGSMINVYESLRRMSDSSLLVPKEGLLSPPCPLQLSSSKESPKLLLPAIKAELQQAPRVPTVVYRCQISGHLSYVSWASGAKCKQCSPNPFNGALSCGSLMTSAMSIIGDPPSFNAAADDEAAAKSNRESGYVQRYLSFIVTDDLCIMPASTIESIVLLNKLQVEKLSDLDSMEAVVSPHEALQLLKVSFTTRTALNQVFGSKVINIPAARN